MADVGGILEIFLFILVAGLVAHFIGAGIHEGIFVGALVRVLLIICQKQLIMFQMQQC